MNAFTLRKAPPEHVEIDGRRYAIRPGFRETLKILRLLEDEEILDGHKAPLFYRLWFPEGAPVDAQSAMCAFGAFARMYETKKAPKKPPVMDFEIDAADIYASFRQQYGMNLFDGNPHWWVFLAMLRGLGEDTALGRKIWLRGVDVSQHKGDDARKLSEAQREVALPERLSRKESAMNDALADALLNGGDVAAVLAALRGREGEAI